jgi:hypothetical protein
MAQFIGIVQGNRGSTSRLGTKETGLYATVNGWHRGIEVRAYHEDGEDCFDIYITGGSTGSDTHNRLCHVAESGVVRGLGSLTP